MSRNVFILATLAIVVSSTAAAQTRFEIQPFAGYKIGGEFPIGPNEFSINPIRFNRSAAGGITIGVNFHEHIGAEFLWNRQPTKAVGLTPSGPDPERIDVKLDQLHGNLILHLRGDDKKLRPFLLMGAGATRGSGPGSAETRFSFGVGGGLKYFPHENIGFRFQGRYAPTYLYSTPTGLWCDWWGFCSVLTRDTYIQQGDFSVGVIFRF